MSDWAEGYVSEIDYTFGYYAELNPLRIGVPLANVGLVAPAVETACELGFGQGISVNIHAAASPVEWWGTDFNPAHASWARSLAATAQSGAQLFDQSFAEFCARGDLPDFDFIALHGIFSWVSAENRAVIVDFVRRKLKVGGVLYVSYNAYPGAGMSVPLRQLLHDHAQTMTAPGAGIVARMEAALDFTDRFLALNPGFALANPSLAARLKVIRDQNRNYLAHEYFNSEWRAFHFAEMVRYLSAAKLSFGASATYLEQIDALNMTGDQSRFIAEIPDPVFRQSLRDFVVNQQFRRDYWLKGARRMTALEQVESLRRLRLIMLTPRHQITFKATGTMGERDLMPDVYNRILDMLEGYASRSLGEIEAALGATGVPLAGVFEAVLVLLGKGDVGVVQDEATQEAVRPRTDRLNRRLLEQARGPSPVPYVASPVTGGGVSMTQFLQLFLLGKDEGRKAPEELADFAWQIMAAQNNRIVKDGRRLETAEESLAELNSQARDFVEHRVPLYRALKIID